ncbi:MAG: hypothetical protein ACXABY_35375, partial [Candidatus Thorarchaeota archaeon]|jgi:hypothetical protein
MSTLDRRAAQNKLIYDQQKDKQASISNLWNLHKEERKWRLDQLNPGETEDWDDFKRSYARSWTLGSASGLSPEEITQLLRTESPLSKPEDELSQSEKLNLELAWARHELNVDESERLESHRERTLLAGQRQDTIAMERDRRSDMRSLISFVADRRTEKFDRIE